jgi:hypothetical protein
MHNRARDFSSEYALSLKVLFLASFLNELSALIAGKIFLIY